MKNLLICCSLVFCVLVVHSADARVGGGRSFGNRGSRGFSSPYSSSQRATPFRTYGQGTQGPQGSATQPQTPYSQPASPYSMPQRSQGSMLRTLGAGLAGGFLGSMLFRSMGGGMPGYGYGGAGGFGPLEILLLGGLLFFVIRMFMNRAQSSPSSDASTLMRQSRPFGWEPNQNHNSPQESYQNNSHLAPGAPLNQDTQSPPVDTIQPEQAMDLFFQIQGAWKNRELKDVDSLLDLDAKSYLEKEVARLKASRQLNCLENIAVRNTEVVDAWHEDGKDFSTVRIHANLLDFTIDEDTQRVIDGSKTVPVKFEEFWTFSKENGSRWKLSAIQQS